MQRNHRYQKDQVDLELNPIKCHPIIRMNFFLHVAIEGTTFIAGNDAGNVSLFKNDEPFVVQLFVAV